MPFPFLLADPPDDGENDGLLTGESVLSAQSAMLKMNSPAGRIG
jgi:hypothetical protein